MSKVGITFFDLRVPITSMGILTREAGTKFNDLIKRTGGERGEAFGPLPDYTVATLPDAEKNAKSLIYVSDGTSNKRLAISDGTHWRWPDGAIVS